jgi:hypothetical protein
MSSTALGDMSIRTTNVVYPAAHGRVGNDVIPKKRGHQNRAFSRARKDFLLISVAFLPKTITPSRAGVIFSWVLAVAVLALMASPFRHRAILYD